MTFAITYFQDELAELPHLEGPLHWHPDFELASVENSTLEYQVGQQRIVLEPGDSIFVNGNVLHGVKQLEGNQPEPMPNIVFSGSGGRTGKQHHFSKIYQTDRIVRSVAFCSV